MDDFERTVLTKGIDLLADWIGSRWRRRSAPDDDNDSAPTDELADGPRGERFDRDALLSSVSQALLRQHQRELESVIERLEIHRSNLQHLEGQRARWGEALVPPIIVNGIRDEQAAVAQRAQRLAELLNAVTGQGLPDALRPELTAHIEPPELPSGS